MSAQIIDGKSIAEHIKQDIKTAINSREEQQKKIPGLAVILTGNNPASEVYVNHKILACKMTGIHSETIRKPADVSENELLQTIDSLNANEDIHGILIQLPLPPHINAETVLERIAIQKDVDGFHPYNMGKLAQRNPVLRPCTPYGVIELLKNCNIDCHGLKATVAGSSNIVGRPMALELLLAGATPTITNRYTPENELISSTLRSDIIVVALGRPGYLKGEWVKPGSIVIDVGINRLENGKLSGDVDFQSAQRTAGWITPVPGGVGPMTVAMLMKNTLTACKMQTGD